MIRRVVPDLQADDPTAGRAFYEHVHPLTDEPWGVRRFFVRSPEGAVVNVVAHR